MIGEVKADDSYTDSQNTLSRTAALDVGQQVCGSNVNCHIVTAPAFLSRRSHHPPASATLAPELLAAAADAVAGWRDTRYAAARLTALRDEKQLPGIAVLYYDRTEPTIPPPIRVPFEPVPLDESEPVICGIVDSTIRRGGARSPATRSAAARWLVRGGVPVIVLINILAQMVVQGVVQQGVMRYWLIGIYLASIFLVALGCWVAYQLSDRWFLIPGGVLRRKSLLRILRGPLHRHVPRDTVLILRLFPMGGCSAELWQNRLVSRRFFTEMEWHALLGAWQSPLPAPPLERMSDLRAAHDL